ncbi:MAG: type II secretion system F family protein [Chthoniobacterales bacterium]
MIRFSYEAFSNSGTKTQGELTARSRGEALSLLQRDALQPTRLRELAAIEPESGESPKSKKVEVKTLPSGALTLREKDIVYFTEELSDLLEAGLQLDPALRIMEQRTDKSNLTIAITQIRQQICDGVRFSHALRNTSKSFGELFCSVVAAGEMSGALPELLRRQVGYLTTISELRSKVVQALIYPSFIFGAGVLLLCIFMSILVPQLSVLFNKTGRTLPLPTRILIGSSDLFAQYWWLIVLLVILGAVSFWKLITSPGGKFWWHRVQLKIPLVGEILSSRFYAQFAHTLANLTANALPLLTGLDLLSHSTPNVFLRERLMRITERVSEGGSLARAMGKVGPFPGLMIDLVSVGEQTGDISTAFRKIGTRYDKDLNLLIQRLTAFIQPVIIIIMAFVVGIVAYSILAGIFQAVAGLRTH